MQLNLHSPRLRAARLFLTFRQSHVVVLFCLFLINHSLSAQTITTVAGAGPRGYGGDGGPATAALLHSPNDIVFDAAGNMFIAEAGNNRIRKITPTGIISTIAGDGTAGFGGDGGLATNARLNAPVALALYGNDLCIADINNHRVRKVDLSTGVISTVAGTGTAGAASGGSLATQNQLNYPVGLAFDNNGNLYISDQGNHLIRRVTPSGTISTVAGTGIAGYSGTGSPATTIQLNFPGGLAFRGTSLYFADRRNHRVRQLNLANNTIYNVVGTGTAGSSGDGGLAGSAQLNEPDGIAFDATGKLYVADRKNHRVRRVDLSNAIISTVAGNGTAGFAGDGGLPSNAQLDEPASVAFDAAENLFIADINNHRIRVVLVTPIALAPSVASNPVCGGGSGTRVSVAVTGGSPPYSYTWVAPANVSLSGNSTSAVTATPNAGVSGVQTMTITVADASATSTSLVSLTVLSTGPVVYVTQAGGTNTQDGSSWATAYAGTALQTAISQASRCPSKSEVWVGAGTYKPTTTTNRAFSFTMAAGVGIYGGFPADGGGATDRHHPTQRNWLTNPTILSGDIGTAGSSSDNSYHVIANNNNGLDATAILDGFQVIDGNANGSGTGQRNGGGIYNVNVNASVRNCIIQGNRATDLGGGLFTEGGSSSLDNLILTDNRATIGGGIYTYNSRLTATSSLLQSNTATNFGGAVTVEGGSSSLNSLTITSNGATTGGGICSKDNSLRATSSWLYGNTATNKGGGLFAEGGSSNLSDMTITDNRAVTGGGISTNLANNLTVANSLVLSNTATNDGGGLNVESSRSVLNSLTISGNWTKFGAGICTYGNNSLTVTNSSVLSNTATRDGGGVYFEGGSSSLNSLTITDNWANSGGGVFLKNNKLTSTNSLLQQNRATDFGGGLYSAQDSQSFFVNSFWENNSSTYFGGALYINNSRLDLINASLRSNNAKQGGAIYLSDNGIMTFGNTIIWGNGPAANSITYKTGVSVYLSATSSLLETGTIGYMGKALSTTISASPFANENGPRLAEDSPAIDSGNTDLYKSVDGPGGDVLRRQRFFPIVVGPIDVGAVEHQIPALHKVSITATPPSVCARVVNYKVVVTGGLAPFTYNWTAPAGITLSGSTTAVTAAAATGVSGVQTLTVTIADRARRVVTRTLSMTVGTSPSLRISVSPSLTILKGQRATLSATGADLYRWSTGAKTPSITSDVSGIFTLWGAVGVCSTTAQATLIVIEDPYASVVNPVYYLFSGNNCTASASIRITGASSIKVSGPGGYKYAFFSRLPISDQLVLNDITAPGQYTCVVANPAGKQYSTFFSVETLSTCQVPTPKSNRQRDSRSARIASDGGLTLTLVPNKTTYTTGELVTVQVSGGTPGTEYSVNLYNGDPTLGASSLFLSASSSQGSGNVITWGSNPTEEFYVRFKSGTGGPDRVLEVTNEGFSDFVDSEPFTIQDCSFTANLIPSSTTLTCAQPSVTLTAFPSGQSYQFDGPGGVQGNSADPSRTVDVPGLYSVTITADNGCETIANTSVNIYEDKNPPANANITVAPSAILTCSQASVTLTAQATGQQLSYAFSGPLGELSSGSTSPIREVTEAGPYSVTITGTNGCTTTVGTTVERNQPVGGIVISPLASGSTVCEGAPIVVSATVSSAGTGFQWYRNGQAITGQTSATLMLGSVGADDSGRYWLVVTGPCSATSTPFELVVNPQPTVVLVYPNGTRITPNGQLPIITLLASTGSYQVLGGVRFRRVTVVDRINGYEISQVEEKTTGIMPVGAPGPFRLTVTSAQGCSRTVQGVLVNP